MTKNDVVSHIQSKGLKPLDLAAAPPPQAAPKAAAATSDGKVKRPNFERPATARREDSGPIKSGNARYTGIDHSNHLQSVFDFEQLVSVYGFTCDGKMVIPAHQTDIPLTSMRAVIAKRLLQSKQTSPHGHATAEANIDAISLIRKDFAAAG